ncbi:MAG TPA: M23 family metallopeptidase [Ignavibacteriales bacterium]|nr:M23 family metallopeptidase [Ignavibacteriales bacterium]
MKIKKLLEYLKYLKISFIVVPVLPGRETHTIKITTTKLLIYFAAHTAIALFLIVFLMAVTPLKSVLFLYETAETRQQAKEIVDLNKKIIHLNKELNHITSLNKNLQFAIFLGDSALADSLGRIRDSAAAKHKSDANLGGNILQAYRNLFAKEEQNTKLIFMNPVSGFISKGYEPQNGHMGIDYALKNNTPIIAAAGGYVVFADYTTYDGYMIILAHDNNYITLYKHCSVLTKKMRDFVNQGEIIAFSGNSGENTTGPHLHFEVWKNGQAIDPAKVLINPREESN